MINPLTLEAMAGRELATRAKVSRELYTRYGFARYFIERVYETVDPANPYVHGWHIDVIAAALNDVHRGRITRLLVTVPPRHLKSITVNVAFTTWLMAMDPRAQLMSASYADELSTEHSVAARNVIRSTWYREAFPRTSIAEGDDRKTKFRTTAGGFRIATTVGGSATGLGGQYIIIDDPIKVQDGPSAARRKAVIDWFRQTLSTRLNNPRTGAIIVIMQRVHEDDLAGYLLKHHAGEWVHLNLPAIAEGDETHEFDGRVWTRVEGDLLHPEYLGHAELERRKRELGSYGFAGQYQQRPSPEGGGLIKLAWFERYNDELRVTGRLIQAVDTGYKTGDGNDPSVILTIAETDRGMRVLDVARGRWEFPELRRRMLTAYQSCAERWRAPDSVVIEDKASGQSLIQDLRSLPLPVVAYMPDRDKVTRAHAVTPIIEAGRVSLPERAHWLDEFESELAAFPAGAHDDQVDALVMALDWLRRGQSIGEMIGAGAASALGN